MSAKKIWGQAVTRLCEQEGLSVVTACKLFGHCRQAYYQLRDDGCERLRRERVMLDAVHEIRRKDSRIGGFKLWLMLRELFPGEWMPGRDVFLNLLRERKLLHHTPKPRRTTNSNHRYHKWKNLIKGFLPSAPNQLWVSDITYIDLDTGNAYLHLVTDAYSRKIIGRCLSPTLEAAYTLEALRMAISGTGEEDLQGLVHHSDRGVQYCCDAYIAELQIYNISISMTEDYKPTDNAIAERVNGIIKTELVYAREKRYRNREEAEKDIMAFIDFYNNERPHASLGMQTPATAHRQTGEQKRLWKKKDYYNKSCENKGNSLTLLTT